MKTKEFYKYILEIEKSVSLQIEEYESKDRFKSSPGYTLYQEQKDLIKEFKEKYLNIDSSKITEKELESDKARLEKFDIKNMIIGIENTLKLNPDDEEAKKDLEGMKEKLRKINSVLI